jgi:hypothetical protein
MIRQRNDPARQAGHVMPLLKRKTRDIEPHTGRGSDNRDLHVIGSRCNQPNTVQLNSRKLQPFDFLPA